MGRLLGVRLPAPEETGDQPDLRRSVASSQNIVHRCKHAESYAANSEQAITPLTRRHRLVTEKSPVKIFLVRGMERLSSFLTLFTIRSR